MTASALERFMAKVDRTRSECWLWTGSLTRDGYPRFKINGRVVRAHRFAYEFFIGEIGAGLDVDHVRSAGCTSRSCCFPGHLEAVSHAENLRRRGLDRSADGRFQAAAVAPLTLWPDITEPAAADDDRGTCDRCSMPTARLRPFGGRGAVWRHRWCESLPQRTKAS